MSGSQQPSSVQTACPTRQQASPQMVQQPLAVHLSRPCAQQAMFPHLSNPWLQMKSHLPLTQIAVELVGLAQTTPPAPAQPPQLLGSVIVLVHWPWQQSGISSGQHLSTHFVGHPASLQTKSHFRPLTQIEA